MIDFDVHFSLSIVSKSVAFVDIKGALCRFENLLTCSCTYKNNVLKISHCQS